MDATTEGSFSEKRLWDLVEKVRGKISASDPFSLLEYARDEGIPISGASLELLVARWQELGEFITPPFLADFIAAYCKHVPPQRILDPCAGLGLLLTRLVEMLHPRKAIGIDVNPRAHDAARLLAPQAPVNWRLGDALDVLDDLTEPFDLIVGDPPLGMAPRLFQFQTAEGAVSVRAEVGHLVLLRASQLLAPGGVAFFVVTPSFLMRRDAASVYALLPRLGLSLDAVLALPRGTFRATSVETSLVVLRREARPGLFVGELTQSATTNRPLLQNLQAHKAGKAVELGALVDPAQFVSLRSLVIEQEVQGLAKRAGLMPTPLASLGAVVKTARREPEEPFTDDENAVYLPLIGRSPAVTSLADLRLKPQNYLQIVLQADNASPLYVAQFFNSPLGQRVREGLTTGAIIPKIAGKGLQNATVYLPPPAVQTKTLQVNALISDSLAQLETLRRQLWANPNRHKTVEKAVLSLNREDNFLAWVETLPYPLASILWAYETATQADRKVRHLLHFFEAYAQFTVALLASGLICDPAFEGNQTPSKAGEPLRASFGVWTRLCREYANRARRMMEEQESRERYRTFYGHPDADFFEMMTDRRIFALLDETKGYRDTWEGHGGNPTPRETQGRLATLQDRLASLRGLVEDRYTTALLLLPDKNEWEEGLYYYQVQAVQGTRTPFAPREVLTREPMGRGKLYLLHNSQSLPIEVLPLLKIMDSPTAQLNTAFFYSRAQNGEAQWVSYQFADESTRTTPEQEVRAALSLLVPIEKPSKS